MAAIHDKINATQFHQPTTLSFEELLEVSREAARVAGGIITTVKEQAVVSGSRIPYKIKRGGALTVLDFTLIYEPVDNGAGTVQLMVGNYLTSQPKLLSVIPIGPKDAAGYPPLKKFSQHVQKALASAHA